MYKIVSQCSRVLAVTRTCYVNNFSRHLISPFSDYLILVQCDFSQPVRFVTCTRGAALDKKYMGAMPPPKNETPKASSGKCMGGVSPLRKLGGLGNVVIFSGGVHSGRSPGPNSSNAMDHKDHTVLPANNTIFAVTHKHTPGGATTHICIVNA